MAFTSAENAANTRLGQYNDSQLANDNHRQNFLPMLSDAATVSRAIAREAGTVAGAAAIIQAFDADADGAFAQYIQADASLRFAAGGLQKHICTAIVSGAGQNLSAPGKTSAIWIDPQGVEHTGATYVSTQRGPHRLWVPASAIGSGVALTLLVGGVLTKISIVAPLLVNSLYYESIPDLDVAPLLNLAAFGCNSAGISALDISALTDLTTVFARSNNLPTLEVSALTKLTGLYCNSNGMTQAGVDNILSGLVTAGASNGTLQIHGTNAAPSSTGLNHVTTLQGRGWAVTHS